jgi:hypothetical protein
MPEYTFEPIDKTMKFREWKPTEQLEIEAKCGGISRIVYISPKALQEGNVAERIGTFIIHCFEHVRDEDKE